MHVDLLFDCGPAIFITFLQMLSERNVNAAYFQSRKSWKMSNLARSWVIRPSAAGMPFIILLVLSASTIKMGLLRRQICLWPYRNRLFSCKRCNCRPSRRAYVGVLGIYVIICWHIKVTATWCLDTPQKAERKTSVLRDSVCHVPLDSSTHSAQLWP